MAFDAREQLANIAVVADETARMARDFRAWPEAHWWRQTYCPGWNAADVVAHLATGADFYAQVITAGRAGTPQPPWGVADVAAFRQRRAAEARRLIEGGPAALLEGFERQAATLQEVLTSLQEADLGKVAWHPRGLVPIGCWVGMRLNELVIHDWDIRQPHEAAASLSPTALPAMLTVLPELQQQFLEQRLANGLDGVYILRTGEAAWAFMIQGTTVTYHAAAPPQFDACLSADAETLILLTMGRADMTAKRQSGALAITGDVEKGQRLCEVLFRTF
ncbi:MAG: hypothetical protein KatS3mg131_3760 [Candidatus Tectimicrobiota bacterium]|nr:MAG: hypothetical protein KatS3mg131_3760 [Candidatus Tectomicrobia bacterium]